MDMQNLDVKKVEVFGWTSPRQDNWWYICNPAMSKGWKAVDVKKAEQSLKANVETCYKTLFTAEFEDLDDSIHYTVFFDNQKKLFDLKLTNSTAGEVLPEQKKELFKSETFKKTAARAYEILLRSKKLVEDLLDDHIEAGEMLAVDETKLSAVLSMLEDQQLLKNFRLRKYAK